MEIFPVLNAIFTKIYGASPYKSPTDMGVNMAGYCIVNDDVVRQAAREEIIRRYYEAQCDQRMGTGTEEAVYKIQLLMQQAGVTAADRPVIAAALAKEEATGEPAMALELPDGSLVTGKTSDLLGPASAVLLNALKRLGDIDDEALLMSPQVIEPIQDLKVNHLGNHNPRLHTDEVLLALAICAVSDPQAKKAIEQLKGLKGCDAHSTVILSQVDKSTFHKLGVRLTCEPKHQSNRLYHR